MMTRPTFLRLAAGALLLAFLGACNPYVYGGTALAVGPTALTGRNFFYHVDKYFGKRCADSTYFDRPLHCVNDAD